ncbi:helix-turn-helix transcriptional regulator [Micromonospora sp. KC213]|uniref:helix-turn-helix transcriptional regulator n=1 Tax=Micromonospora sp. KC213 TaxID=2530378 RepID=UPI00104F4C19|nr:helix-turn-helix transcriptional regulator [Micromonospora sp. KC213]TDC40941.1 AraC family transcriptional regulator [Micromonospora sp. KC213]
MAVDDFASAVLVAAARRALAEEGIAVAVATPGGALVPLDAKRRFLADIARAHGLLPLLRVGRYLPRLPPDPAISALLASDSPEDLFERWGRLERFTHSRHRVLVREAGAARLVAEHVGPPAAPPTPAEDALILGVLTGLLAAIGARGVTVRLDTSGETVVFTDGAFTAPPPGQATAVWHFAWESFPNTAKVPVPVVGLDPTQQARHLIGSDLARRWRLAGLAAEFGLSPRSLQRRLLAEGGLSGLLGSIRAQAAADLLMNSSHPLSVVGFACGYADQPHFTREFKRRTAMTPAAYRSAFARRPAAQPATRHISR